LQDRHTEGLFSQAEWLEALHEEGFVPHMLPFDHSEVEPGTVHLFVGEKPTGAH
jgi:hypothetical protein